LWRILTVFHRRWNYSERNATGRVRRRHHLRAGSCWRQAHRQRSLEAVRIGTEKPLRMSRATRQYIERVVAMATRRAEALHTGRWCATCHLKNQQWWFAGPSRHTIGFLDSDIVVHCWKISMKNINQYLQILNCQCIFPTICEMRPVIIGWFTERDLQHKPWDLNAAIIGWFSERDYIG